MCRLCWGLRWCRFAERGWAGQGRGLLGKRRHGARRGRHKAHSEDERQKSRNEKRNRRGSEKASEAWLEPQPEGALEGAHGVGGGRQAEGGAVDGGVPGSEVDVIEDVAGIDAEVEVHGVVE